MRIALASRVRRVAPAMRRIPSALLVLLAVGVGLRVAMWIAYSPAVMNLADSTMYVWLASDRLFTYAPQSAGYPLFLRGLHAISDEYAFTIGAQHLLGLLSAVLLYGGTRRLGAPVWVGCVAAAAVLLSLDQVFLEHAFMTESLFTFLLVAAAYCALRALEPARVLRGPVTTRTAWIAAAGTLLGATAYVRPYTTLIIPFFGLWLLLAFGRPWRARVARAAVGVGAAVLVVLIYAAAQYWQASYFGLTKGSGWAVYSRSAQFADCSKFTPPPGTSGLCQDTPESQRPGPDFYSWHGESPARRLFGSPPNESEKLRAFGTQAILHQPLDYVEAVLNDTVRYFAPEWNADRVDSGAGYGVMDIDRRAPGVEEFINEDLNDWYDPRPLRIRGGVTALSDLQALLRVHPFLLLQFLLAGIAGIVLARGRLRAAIVLLLGFAALLLALPPVTAIYGARYAIPVDGLMAAAGALGVWAALQRRGSSSAPTNPSARRPRRGSRRAQPAALR